MLSNQRKNIFYLSPFFNELIIKKGEFKVFLKINFIQGSNNKEVIRLHKYNTIKVILL